MADQTPSAGNHPEANPESKNLPAAHEHYESATVRLLAILFFLTGLVFVVLDRQANIAEVWTVLVVCFSFAMLGSLVLFHYLSSSAHIAHDYYRVGGAAAGFLVLFGTFYSLSSEAIFRENRIMHATRSEIIDDLLTLTDYYELIRRHENATLNGVAKGALNELQRSFRKLSEGTYTISASDLPIHLLPMARNARSSLYATQYVLPSTFWDQYWSASYFDENAKAVARGVKILRIFILDERDDTLEKKILDSLIAQHIEHGIGIRFLDRRRYQSEVGTEPSDMIIIDEEITGILVLGKEGEFNEVEFSVDEFTIRQRMELFTRYRAYSLSYHRWKELYRVDWLSNAELSSGKPD